MSVFQTSQASNGTISGEVTLALSKCAKVLTPTEQQRLQRELGVLAGNLLEKEKDRDLWYS